MTPEAQDTTPYQSSSGFTVGVAEDLDSVTAAWQLVYTSYRRRGLIRPNPQRLHTAPQAVGIHSAVIVGRIGEMTVTTLTAVADERGELPLDRLYRSDLTQLRRQGRTLVEVGLFGDRRFERARSAEALCQLMRYAFYYGFWRYTDIVIGVHPRHAPFYSKSIGFQTIGPTRSYFEINDRPVVLQRLDIQEKLNQPSRPAVLDFFAKNQVPAEAFDRRFAFQPDQIAGSALESFLKG